MHLSNIAFVAVATYASWVAARPWAQGAPNFPLGKRQFTNTSSTTSDLTSSSALSSATTLASTTLSLTSISASSIASSTSASSIASSTSASASASASSIASSASTSASASASYIASSTSASASASASSVAVPGGTYTSVGCYTDTANVGYPLVNAVLVSSSSSSVECLSLCANPSAGGPFQYAGVEGSECFCSNSFSAAATQSSSGSCSGNTKRDGLGKRASNNISIFQFTPTTSSSSTVVITTSSGTVSSSPSSTVVTATSSGTVSSSPSSTVQATGPSSQVSTGQPTLIPYPFPVQGFTIRPGDTLASIARQLGISLSELEATNPQISDPNSLEIDQVISVPSYSGPRPPPGPNPFPNYASVYTVAAGDTLSSIAQRYGLSLFALEAVNPQIPNKNFIQAGQIINFPTGNGQFIFEYTVSPGDSLSAIAQAFGITLAVLEASNSQIANPNLIFPGQIVNVPLSL